MDHIVEGDGVLLSPRPPPQPPDEGLGQAEDADQEAAPHLWLVEGAAPPA